MLIRRFDFSNGRMLRVLLLCPFFSVLQATWAQETVQLRLDPEQLSDADAAALAEIANPTVFQDLSRDWILGDLIKAQCRMVPETFYAAARRFNPRRDWPDNSSSLVVRAGTVFYFPFCPQSPLVPLDENEVVDEVFADISAGISPATENLSSPQEICSVIMKDFLPIVVCEYHIMATQNLVETLLSQTVIARADIGRTIQNTEIIESADELVHYTDVGDTMCVTDGLFQYGGRTTDSRLRDAIVRTFSIASDVGEVEEVKMGLLDSGLFQEDGVLAPDDRRVKAFFANDTGGSSSADTTPPLTMLPTPGKPDARLHGTQVLSLALGGPNLISLTRLLDLTPDIRVAQIYKGDGPEGTFRTDISSLEKVGQAENMVINLSVGRSNEFDRFRTDVVGTKSLFIVAAGNLSDAQVGQEVHLYPAAYGGAESLNIVTVASVDGNGSLSRFSNSSSNFVDLAAPGCQREVVTYNIDTKAFKRTRVSGTSFAAPQVTFAAVLLRKLGLSVNEIKWRILSTSDILPDLTETVIDGRILNIEKAVSIYDDVVTLRAANETSVRFGRFSREPRVTDVCNGLAVSADARLRKIRIDFDGRKNVNGKSLVYYSDGGRYRRAICNTKDFALEFLDSARDETTILVPSGVEDIALKLRNQTSFLP